jgi:oligoribonuclease
MGMTDRLVWIDCEMTGLDLARDALVEIACVVTDGELKPVDEGVDLVIKPPAEALDSMPEVVRDMHTASGLLAELAAGITLAEAQDQVVAYVRAHVPESRKAPLCGNSIATDRMFIARDMPVLDAFLHYRMVDVSSIKELARRWYPRAYFASPEKRGGHRALADIRESIQELRYYREAVFVPPPGPDTSTAREIAARHRGQDGAVTADAGAQGTADAGAQGTADAGAPGTASAGAPGPAGAGAPGPAGASRPGPVGSGSPGTAGAGGTGSAGPAGIPGSAQ